MIDAYNSESINLQTMQSIFPLIEDVKENYSDYNFKPPIYEQA